MAVMGVSLVTILAIAAILALMVSTLFFFRRWKTLRMMVEDIEATITPCYHADDLSKGYYCVHARGNREEISTSLKRLFNLPESINSRSVLLSLLTRQSAERLDQTLENLSKEAALLPHQREVPSQILSLTVRTNAPLLSERKYFEVIAYNLFGKNGRYRGVVVEFHDVTRNTVRSKRLKMENKRLKTDYLNASHIINALPFPVWRRDSDLNIHFCNMAYSAIAGDDAENHLPLELTKQSLEIAQKATKTQQSQGERHHIIVEGKRHLYKINEIPIPETHTLTGFALDITAKEELEHDLERHIAAQACLLESSASGMALFGFDTRLKLYNNAYVMLWGLDESWLAKQPTYSEVLETLREKRKLPEQANFPDFKKRHLSLFTDLIEPHNEFFYLPDGTALRVIAIPHALGGLLFAYEDMTDKLAMERSYNTLIAVQRTTLDHLHEGVAVFGPNGRLKLSNPIYAKLWGLDPKMLEDEPHISHILDHTKQLYRYGGDWQHFKEEIIMRATNRQPIHQCFERTDDKVLEWVGMPLPDGAILMTYQDVTDSTLVERSLRERNEALEAADRLKTEFLANVSYELRSPLTTIIGFAEILQNYFTETLQDKELGYISAIYNSSQHLMGIINDILDLASIEAGYMKLKPSHFDVYEMLSSITPLIRQRVKENQLIFRIHCNHEIGKMEGDELRIKQIIFKLLSNAIKFSKPNTMITLGAKAHGEDEIVIWVEDRGVGIPEGEQKQVFNKFYKSSVIRSNDQGPGLGLSVVKNFMQLHGGRVELKSQVDVGTKFLCYFKRQLSAVQDNAEPTQLKTVANP